MGAAPVKATCMEHLDFDLRLELWPEGLRVRVQNSPAGEEAHALLSLPRLAHDGTLERLGRAVHQSRDVQPAAGLPGELESPREVAQRIGNDLFQALFTGSVRQRFEESLVHAGSLPGQLLRVRLRYSLTEPELASAVVLPWEYMAHEGSFLGLNPAFSVVRYPEVARPPSPPPFEPPLRIALLAGSRAGRPLGIYQETKRIVEAWKDQSDVVVEPLERRSAAALRSQIHDGGFHVLHFMGHGRFNTRDGRGAIILEDEQGDPDAVDGETLAGLLAGLRPLRLVVLNACETATIGAGDPGDPSLGVASALIRAGLPAVIAMQYQISDPAAIAFGAALYERLARGESVDEAVTAGRLAIHNARRRSLEWGTPVLFLRSPDGRLFRTPAYLALHQLPPPPADFTGREAELAELRQAVEQGGAMISGLRGMGGVGKTALALQLAEELRPAFPDAQLYLDLKGVDPEPLSSLQAMAHVVRAFHQDTRLPETQEEMAALYRSVLDRKRVLLLMDNAAGPEQVEPLIPPKGSLLLVTSRFRFSLPGFKARDLEELPPEKARMLLLAIEPRIGESAAEIARLCGGLPFALRLAGGALVERPDLTPARYVERLADAAERLGLIEASLTLSYELLSEDLQKHWRELAVFPGAFGAGAAAAVWGVEPDAADEILGVLVKSSLVDGHDGRYRLHDLARVFADSRLEEAERTEAGRRHAGHYAEVLAAAENLYDRGGESVLAGLRLFDLEWDNIQAGFAWATARAEVDEATASLCSQYPGMGTECLNLRQPKRERIQWLESALAAARRLGDRAVEGSHLGNLGITYQDLGDARRARKYFEQVLQIARETGDRFSEGKSLGHLGTVYRNLGEARLAIEHYQQHLQIAREIGNRGEVGAALGGLGIAHGILGDTERSIEYLEQWLQIARQDGDRRSEGQALGNLGNVYNHLGTAQRAIEYYERSLQINREIGDRHGEGQTLGNLGNAYTELGDAQGALEHYEQYLQIAREVGDRQGEGLAVGSLGNVHVILGDSRRAIDHYKQSLQIAREIGDRMLELNASWNLGERYEAEGDLEQAVELMQPLVGYGREIGHRDAKKWAAQVEAIRGRLQGGKFTRFLRRLFQRKKTTPP